MSLLLRGRDDLPEDSVSSKADSALRTTIVTLILKYDLLNRIQLRDAFQAVFLANEDKRSTARPVQKYWPVILCLSKAYLTGTPTVVTDICLMSDLSDSTVKRQLNKLVLHGVVDKRPDRNDHRRQFVVLKKPCLDVLDGFVAECDVEFKELIEHHDRRERKTALKALEESERRFRDYAEMSSNWFWEMNEKLRFTRISDGMVKSTGMDRSFFIGKTRREIVADKDRDSPYIARHLKSLDDRKAFKDFIYKFKTPIDRERYACVTAIPLFNDQGKFLGYRGTTSDITDRKLAEIALLESEKKYRELFDNSISAIYVFDAERNFIDSNQAGLDMLGYSREELLDLNFADLEVGHEDISPLRQRFSAGGEIVNFEHQLKRRDGAVIYVLNNSRLFTDDRGCVTGMQSIIFDITERRKTENILHNVAAGVSGTVGRAFFDTLAGFLEKALEADYAFVGKLTEGGRSVWTVSFSVKGKISRNFEYLLEGTPCETAFSKNLAIYEKGVAERFPDDKGLRDRNIESYAGASLFDSMDRPLGVLVVMSEKPMKFPTMVRSLLRIFAVRAATELERETALEKLRLSKEEAEQANRSKSEFLASVSHDLRTPLNAIMGFSEMMTERVYGSLGDSRYEAYAKDILDSGGLLLSLIDDILDLSKIEAGKYELDEEILNIPMSIKASVRMLNIKARNKKIRLVNACAPDLPMLRGDRKAVAQILNNLLSNAIKFTPDKGRVVVNAWKGKDNKFNIQVSDTGIGMSRKDITRALNPFEQVNSRHSRKNAGTGLGLHLCCRLVDMHEGEMTFVSEIDKGTTVTISFPSKRVVMES